MDNINVITLNPAKSASDSVRPELLERMARNCRIRNMASASARSSRQILNSVFGINNGVSTSMSNRLLVLRVISGALLILFSDLEGLGSFAFTPEWCQLLLGCSLIAGLFTRILSLAVFGIFATFAIQKGIADSLDPYLILPAMTALVFTVVGPGIFSIDQLMRKALIGRAKHRAKRKAEKLANIRLSYRAFAYRR